MKNCFLFVLLCVVGLAIHAQVRLPRATPESQGLSSAVIKDAISEMLSARNTEIHSIIMMRHGQVIAEVYPQPWSATSRHTMYSVSKTFTALAVGMAIEDNRLRLTDRIGALLYDKLPKDVVADLADMTVNDLLTMQSGIKPQYTTLRNVCSNWTSAYLTKQIEGRGTKFQYDSMCSYLLSVIVERVTGEKLIDYLNRRIIKPMGITTAQMEISPEGHCTGGWGLYITPELMAMTGQLLLQHGRWGSLQLVDSTWVDSMMTVRAGTNYGYQMWQGSDKKSWEATGSLGQYIVVSPHEDMVMTVTQCSNGSKTDMRKIFYNKVLKECADSLPANQRAYNSLTRFCSEATLPLVSGKRSSPFLANYVGRRLVLPQNRLGFKSITLTQHGDTLQMMVEVKGESRPQRLTFGAGKWVACATGGMPPYSIGAVGKQKGLTGAFTSAGSYGWNSNVLTMKNHYNNWISSLRWTITFPSKPGEMVYIKLQENYESKPITLAAE